MAASLKKNGMSIILAEVHKGKNSLDCGQSAIALKWFAGRGMAGRLHEAALFGSVNPITDPRIRLDVNPRCLSRLVPPLERL